MGLDNGLIFKIKCPSLNLEREYEVCYFRKYWGLRDKILQILDAENEQYLYPVSKEELYSIKGLFEHYCNVTNIREANLSTIWRTVEETYHMRDETKHLEFAIDFIEEKISLYEFISALKIWEDNWRAERNIVADTVLCKYYCEHEMLPEDIEWSFEFYDSY